MMPRLTIAGMMTITLVLAVDLAALRSSSSASAASVFTLTLGLLLTASLAILYLRAGSRTFWVGFTLFGGCYLLVAFGPWFRSEVEPYLATTRLFDELYLTTHPKPPRAGALAEDMDLYSYTYRSYDPEILWHRRLADFLRIGHAISAQLFAIAGGLMALRFRTAAVRAEART